MPLVFRHVSYVHIAGMEENNYNKLKSGRFDLAFVIYKEDHHETNGI